MVLWASLGLAGCATPPRPDDAPPAWRGRMALKVAATPETPARSLSAGFELTGDDHAGELRLFSPLGTQLVAARWQPGQAELQDTQGTRAFTDLASLAWEALGEDVPLAALPHWLAARAWPAQPAQSLPTGFSQLGWTIDTREAGEGRILAQRERPPAMHLRVLLDR